MRGYRCLGIALLLGICFIGCESDAGQIETFSVTLQEIAEDGIVNYVDSLIVIESQIYWNNHSFLANPDSLWASELRLMFSFDSFPVAPERGNMFVVSEQFQTRWLGDRWNGYEEVYFYNNQRLSNNCQKYLLFGRIRFRDWLNVSSDWRNNTAFVDQCNNYTYWNQTFEFHVDGIDYWN
ncbi:MAG: hypothetical protein WC326_14700 [Candidatus Delongbacteria bacterium]